MHVSLSLLCATRIAAFSCAVAVPHAVFYAGMGTATGGEGLILVLVGFLKFLDELVLYIGRNKLVACKLH